MAKQRLFPKAASDKREPHERFNALAAKVITVPKTEIDQREKEWQRKRPKRA
jgi:hypothetical protein